MRNEHLVTEPNKMESCHCLACVIDVCSLAADLRKLGVVIASSTTYTISRVYQTKRVLCVQVRLTIHALERVNLCRESGLFICWKSICESAETELFKFALVSVVRHGVHMIQCPSAFCTEHTFLNCNHLSFVCIFVL